MEFGLLPFTAALFAFLLFCYFLRRAFSFFRGNKDLTTEKPLPEPAGKWPLIGHLHLLRGQKRLHLVFGEMADKYGPIFSIRLGGRRVMVVSSSEMAKECLTGTNDTVFNGRPKSIAMETMGYNYALFIYNRSHSYWRAIRKIATTELLTSRRLGMISHVWESEVKEAIQVLYKQCCGDGKKDPSVLIELKEWSENLIMRIDCRIMVGKLFDEEEAELCRAAFRGFFDLMGVITLGDAFPFLRRWDIGGYEKMMKKTARDMDSLLQRWLDEHKQKKRNISLEGNYDHQWSFMEALVNTVDENVVATAHGQNFDVDTIDKATCMNLALASTESTTMSLTWILALLLDNQKILNKAQEELDVHIGRARQVKESDMKNLVYLEAIIKESLRLHPPTQMSPPREALEDCNVGGYHVPAGTTLLINLWKIHHDDRVWVDPCEFKPERFLPRGRNEDIDMRGQNFELIPFGSGRRVCPGISFALQIIQFTLASLLHGFEINTVGEAVDMTESCGFTNFKVAPLEVVLTPRLPGEAYE